MLVRRGKRIKVRGIKALWTIILTLLILSIGVMNVNALPATSMTIEPDQLSGKIGETFTVDIIIHNAADLFAWQINVTWNSNFINVTADYDEVFHYWIPRVTYGDVFADQPEGTNKVKNIDWVDSWYMVGETTIGTHPGVDGSGWLASIEFEVFGAGDTTLDISSNYWLGLGATTVIINSDTDQMPMTVEDGYFAYVSSPWDEDINEDGLIDVRDLAMVARKFGWTGTAGSIPEDISGESEVPDGTVDIWDLSAVAQQYGKYYP